MVCCFIVVVTRNCLQPTGGAQQSDEFLRIDIYEYQSLTFAEETENHYLCGR